MAVCVKICVGKTSEVCVRVCEKLLCGHPQVRSGSIKMLNSDQKVSVCKYGANANFDVQNMCAGQCSVILCMMCMRVWQFFPHTNSHNIEKSFTAKFHC